MVKGNTSNTRMLKLYRSRKDTDDIGMVLLFDFLDSIPLYWFLGEFGLYTLGDRDHSGS